MQKWLSSAYKKIAWLGSERRVPNLVKFLKSLSFSITKIFCQQSHWLTGWIFVISNTSSFSNECILSWCPGTSILDTCLVFASYCFILMQGNNLKEFLLQPRKTVAITFYCSASYFIPCIVWYLNILWIQ